MIFHVVNNKCRGSWRSFSTLVEFLLHRNGNLSGSRVRNADSSDS